MMGMPFAHLIRPERSAETSKRNVLVIVFDAFSARHISLYGYRRETTPNLTRLAERAIVYHNHYAGGNFTVPGTASLFTGTLPWTHRAFGFNSEVTDSMAEKSFFHVFDDYYRIAYSHNPLVMSLLNKFSPAVDSLIPLGKFLLTNDNLVDKLFKEDDDIASVAWSRILKKEEGYSYSLFLSDVYKAYRARKLESLSAEFPRGLPSVRADNYFTLEMVMDWLKAQVGGFPRPFLGYFHFMPPHQPYATQIEFYDRFLGDGFVAVDKPVDTFTQGASPTLALKRRQQYDEFILYLDAEFGKLFDHLENIGLLDDTWVVLTSDHGELFERGIIGHVTPVLYGPVVHVPLMIFEPNRTERLDIHDRTSAIDVLPSLLNVTGGEVPGWAEGVVLPPFSQSDNSSDRSVYAVEAKKTVPGSLISPLTVTLMRNKYKLMYFSGYEELRGQERIELYDLDQDPNELNNIYPHGSRIGGLMLEELKSKLLEVDNRPF
jgi:hypothetical protein